MPTGAHENEGNSTEFLTFRLGGEEYALNILRVQEIREYQQPTAIANAPKFIRGVIDLRGVVVPIIDLRVRFCLEQALITPFTVVIILRLPTQVVGIVVDAVADVLRLSPAQIRPAPNFSSSVDTSYIDGLACVDARKLIVIDIDRMMLRGDMGLAAPV